MPRHDLWVSFCVPDRDLPAEPLVFEPNGFPALLGARVGTRARLVHVLCDLDANARIQGAIRGAAPTRLAAPKATPLPKQAPVGNPIPEVLVRLGKDLVRWRPKKLITVEEGPARSVRKAYGRIPKTGLVANFWFYLYPGQRSVPFELLLVHSDPRCNTMKQHVDELALELPDAYPLVHYLKARGGEEPHEVNGDRNLWRVKLTGKTWFGDGQGAAWRGRILFYQRATQAERWNLAAEMKGPAFGMALNWNGSWYPWGVVPDLHPLENTAARGFGRAALARRQRRFNAHLAKRPGLWAEPPLAIARPRNTGDRYDFGVTKMAPALAPRAGGPEHLWETFFSALYEAQRPSYFYEANGERLRSEDHPRLVFWGLRPHWHGGVCTDRLGKKLANGDIPSVKHNGDVWVKDWEHISSNVLAGTALLTGSHLLRELCAHEAEGWLLGKRVDRGRGDARGAGRTTLHASIMYLLSGDERLRQRMRDRAKTSYADLLDPKRADWQIRLLSWGADKRKLQGKPSWAPWEEALAVVGWDAAGQIGVREAFPISKILARTLVYWGWWREKGRWVTGDAIEYLTGEREGQALSAKAYKDPTRASSHYGTAYDVWGWGAVLIARRYAQEARDADYIKRCESILAQLRANYLAARKPPGFAYASEWKAVR